MKIKIRFRYPTRRNCPFSTTRSPQIQNGDARGWKANGVWYDTATSKVRYVDVSKYPIRPTERSILRFVGTFYTIPNTINRTYTCTYTPQGVCCHERSSRSKPRPHIPFEHSRPRLQQNQSYSRLISSTLARSFESYPARSSAFFSSPTTRGRHPQKA